MTQPDSEPNQHEVVLKEIFRRMAFNGFTSVGMFDCQGQMVPYCYTVGLMDKGLPELFLTAPMSPHSLEKLLNYLAQEAIDGNITLLAGEEIMVGGKLQVRFEAKPDTNDMLYARLNAQTLMKKLRAIQIVLPGPGLIDVEG